MITTSFRGLIFIGVIVYKCSSWQHFLASPIRSRNGWIENHKHWHAGRQLTTGRTTWRLFNTGDENGGFLGGLQFLLSKFLGQGKDDDSEKEFYRIPLDLEMERQLMLRGEPPMATITWFDLGEDQTSQDAVEFFQDRANQIVLANPWLQSGSIERNFLGLLFQRSGGENNANGAELVYTTTLDDYPKIEIASVQDAQRLSLHGPDLPIQGSSEYKAAFQYTTLNGEKSKGGPLWRITVVPSYGSFGLILSISHFVADIHVYYKIFDMLTCPSQEIGSLDLSTPYVQTEEGDYASSDDLAQFHIGGPRVWKLIHSPWLSVKGILGIWERYFWRPLAEGPTKNYSQYDEYGTPLSTVRLKRRNQGVAYWFEVDHYELSLVKKTLLWEEEKEEAMVYGSSDDGIVVVSDEFILDEFDLDGSLRVGSKQYQNDISPRRAVEEATRSTSSTWRTNNRADSRAIPSVTPEEKISFVSTNDVLSAWFFQMSRCRMGLICCNYRGKLQDHHEYLARNYWGTYALAPDQFTSPLDIRQHLQQPTASPDQFPVLAAELLKPRPLAIVSSWTIPTSTSQQQQQLQQGQTTYFPTSEQKSHWPLYDFASYCPSNFVVLRTWWIQRPSPKMPKGRIGVYVAGDATWLVEPIEFWSMIPSFLIEFPPT